MPRFEREYGDFQYGQDFSSLHVTGLAKESRTIRGVIVAQIAEFAPDPSRVLLAGEYNRDKSYYVDLFARPNVELTTAGIGGDMDFEWDYEFDPPGMNGEFDLAISQAMLEHLLNPYKHLSDLAGLLDKNGVLIAHTHVPGFPYHRFPVDCVRFFPDWFEESAKRLDLVVLGKHVGDLRICYAFQKR